MDNLTVSLLKPSYVRVPSHRFDECMQCIPGSLTVLNWGICKTIGMHLLAFSMSTFLLLMGVNTVLNEQRLRGPALEKELGAVAGGAGTLVTLLSLLNLHVPVSVCAVLFLSPADVKIE